MRKTSPQPSITTLSAQESGLDGYKWVVSGISIQCVTGPEGNVKPCWSKRLQLVVRYNKLMQVVSVSIKDELSQLGAAVFRRPNCEPVSKKA